MNKHLLLLFIISLATLTSCHDEEDNYVPTAWEFEQYGENDIRPGDNFYRYVCGKGVSTPGSDSWTPLARWIKQESDFRNLMCDDSESNPIPIFKRINELRSLTSSPENVNTYISNLKQRINAIEPAKSMKDIPLCLANIIKAGYQFITLQPNITDGRKFSVSPFMTYPMYQLAPQDLSETEKDILTKAGLYDEYEKKFPLAKEMYEFIEPFFKNRLSSNLLQASKAEDCEQIIIQIENNRRILCATDQSALEKFAEALGNKNPDFIPLDNGTTEFFNQLDKLDDSWTEKMNALIWCECTANDLKFYTEPDIYKSLYLTITVPILMINASHYFCDHHVDVASISHNHEIFELLRNTFRNKIERNKWMSSTAKTGAIAKIDAMECHTGILDWEKYEAPTPQSGDFCSAIREIISSSVSILTRIGGDNSNLDNIAAIYMTIPLFGYPSFTANSFYAPNANAIFILPSTSIITGMSQECNMLMPIIGHEMCHGFDAEGAKYDELGNFRDWWTIEDKLRFKEKQTSMISIFNQYVAYDKTFCNGEQTLQENMADLGGMEIAHEATMTQLRRTYTGKELQEKERRFFKSYAIFMAKYYTDADKERLTENDPHSLSEIRVNGILNNIDAWYDAFDVKRGDKFYLAPEQRVHLW